MHEAPDAAAVGLRGERPHEVLTEPARGAGDDDGRRRRTRGPRTRSRLLTLPGPAVAHKGGGYRLRGLRSIRTSGR